MTDELKPCPFCDCQLIKEIVPPPHKAGWDREFHHHPESDCFMSETHVAPHRYAAWNTRAAPKVKELVWHDKPEFEYNAYGGKNFGEFPSEYIVATCKTTYCAIYRHSPEKFMWVDGTSDNIRYSTYRQPPKFEAVEIPWLNSIEEAKAAAQADYERRVLACLEGVGEC